MPGSHPKVPTPNLQAHTDNEEGGTGLDSLVTSLDTSFFRARATSWGRHCFLWPQAMLCLCSVPSYLDIIEQAISTGDILLIENIGETVDPVLDPLLGRNTIKKGR